MVGHVSLSVSHMKGMEWNCPFMLDSFHTMSICSCSCHYMYATVGYKSTPGKGVESLHPNDFILHYTGCRSNYFKAYVMHLCRV